MSGLPITALDLAAIAVVLLSGLLALSRGLTSELVMFASWIGAASVAWIAFTPLRPIILEAVGNDLLADLATAALVFVGPLIAFKIIGSMINRRASESGLGAADKLLGLIFGVGRGALLVCLAYLLGSMIVAPDRQPAWVQDAYLLPPIERGARLIASVLPEETAAMERLARGGAAAAQDTVEAGKGYDERQRRQLERLLGDDQ